MAAFQNDIGILHRGIHKTAWTITCGFFILKPKTNIKLTAGTGRRFILSVPFQRDSKSDSSSLEERPYGLEDENSSYCPQVKRSSGGSAL